MELKIELKDEVVQDAAENIAKHLNNCTRELRRLYLVEDYVDSLKVCFAYIYCGLITLGIVTNTRLCQMLLVHHQSSLIMNYLVYLFDRYLSKLLLKFY